MTKEYLIRLHGLLLRQRQAIAALDSLQLERIAEQIQLLNTSTEYNDELADGDSTMAIVARLKAMLMANAASTRMARAQVASYLGVLRPQASSYGPGVQENTPRGVVALTRA